MKNENFQRLKKIRLVLICLGIVVFIYAMSALATPSYFGVFFFQPIGKLVSLGLFIWMSGGSFIFVQSKKCGESPSSKVIWLLFIFLPSIIAVMTGPFLVTGFTGY